MTQTLTAQTFGSLLDYAYFKDAVVRADVPADYVDDSGFEWTREVPADRVEPFCNAVHAHYDTVDGVWRCDADDLPVWQHFQHS